MSTAVKCFRNKILDGTFEWDLEREREIALESRAWSTWSLDSIEEINHFTICISFLFFVLGKTVALRILPSYV